MKRIKRKYTRKPKPDALQSKSSPIKEESSVLPRMESVSISGGIPKGVDLPDTTTSSSHKEFVYIDLPFSIRQGVENSIEMRKRVGLPDDSKERKERAIKYFRGDRPR